MVEACNLHLPIYIYNNQFTFTSTSLGSGWYPKHKVKNHAMIEKTCKQYTGNHLVFVLKLGPSNCNVVALCEC